MDSSILIMNASDNNNWVLREHLSLDENFPFRQLRFLIFFFDEDY